MSVVPAKIEHMFDNTQAGPRVGASPTQPEGYAEPVYTSSLDEQAALVDLLRTRPQGKTWTELTSKVRFHGNALQARDALQPEILFGSPDRDLALAEAAADVRLWADDGLDFLTVVDDRYPGSVRDIHQAPPFLFTVGKLVPGDVGVSVVGSRDVSAQGIKMATSVARALVGLGVTVISGLAKGVDAAAHRATLEAGGRPVGVIATGIRKQYPAENRALQEAVVKNGLLISQFWPDAPPQKHNFLMRNATMSGYGIATVVIEAGEMSGARAQARMAVEHGRPVILTDMVLEKTEWAKALEGRPGVHIASATSDVIDVVQGLLEAPEQVERVLQSLSAV